MSYQVLVTYHDTRAGVWRSPTYKKDDAYKARQCYAEESSRMWKGGIRAVYLTLDGVVVAQAQDEGEL